MSWIPLRDSFTLTEQEQGDAFTLSEKIDDEARAENHKDSCGCDGGADNCRYGSLGLFTTPSEYVIGWLFREGAVTADQIRALAAPNKQEDQR